MAGCPLTISESLKTSTVFRRRKAATYLINGNMTKLKDAGIFAASAQTQEEADETKETQTEPEPEDGRTRFRKKEAL